MHLTVSLPSAPENRDLEDRTSKFPRLRAATRSLRQGHGNQRGLRVGWGEGAGVVRSRWRVGRVVSAMKVTFRTLNVPKVTFMASVGRGERARSSGLAGMITVLGRKCLKFEHFRPKQ
jgi:hypothetical protein